MSSSLFFLLEHQFIDSRQAALPAIDKAAIGLTKLASKLDNAFPDLAFAEVAQGRRLIEADIQGSKITTTALVVAVVLIAVLALASLYIIFVTEPRNEQAEHLKLHGTQVPGGSPLAADRLSSLRGAIGGTLRYFNSTDSEVLCPSLVIEQPAGLMCEITGTIAPHQQEDVVEVIRLSGEKDILARLFISETGHDCGVVLESSKRLPLAFVDTSNAINAQVSKPTSAKRQATISGVPLSRGSQQLLVFAVVRAEGSTFIARRGGSDTGPILYSIVPGDGFGERGRAVIDSSGRHVATDRKSVV